VSRSLLRLLTLLLVVGAGAGACSLGGRGGPDAVVEVARAVNVFPGSDVRVLGLTVGRITDVAVTEGSGTVQVSLDLADGVRLPADVHAHVVQGSLLGERFVELSPAYTDGPVLPVGGTIPVERTSVPAEFDEILESLHDAMAALPPDELARAIRNSADVLEGRGDTLGRTLEDVAAGIGALRAADDDLVGLVRHLADLNATLATRDQAMGRAIADYGELLAMLADERHTIDASLGEVARMVVELRGLLAANAGRLDETVEGVTRVGRTVARNLDEVDLLLFGQSELYRHAERVMDLDHNWLPLVNHDRDLGRLLQDRLTERLVGLCERAELPECSSPAFWEEELPEEICLPGVLPCRDAGAEEALDEAPLDEVLTEAAERVPQLADAIRGALPGRTPGLPLRGLR
jgi:phospholipid/cholesterol/gamma-HCH transport system substrate-binding protein